MPRAKKAAPPPVKSLEGCSITFASYAKSSHKHCADKTVTQLKEDIAACGGTYTTQVDQSTHLVANQSQYDKKSNRVEEALSNPDVKVVSYDWLADSLLSKKPVPIDDYLFDSTAVKGADIDDAAKALSVDDAPVDSKKKKKPAKRSRQDDADEAEDKAPKKVKAEPNSKAVTEKPAAQVKVIKIPVDEQCPNADTYHVYVDPDGLAWDATLNQTNAGNNNNKFYRLQILVDSKKKFNTWTRWGRVGDRGQSKMLAPGSTADDAISEFKKKFKDKNGHHWEERDKPAPRGKYTFIELNYEESDDEEKSESPRKKVKSNPEEADEEQDDEELPAVESKLPDQVQRLMELIFNTKIFNNTMKELDYDANKMPLGKLSNKTLLKGYEVLKDLASLIADPANHVNGGALEDKSNLYFSLVPHVVSRRGVPVLSTMDAVKREIDLLETLTDMQLANDIMKLAKVSKSNQDREMHLLDRQFQGLGLKEMSPLASTTQEYREISTYLLESIGQSHYFDYKIQDIFRIERNGETDRLVASPYNKLGKGSDRRLLWHGSRCSNFGGILSQGLRIAPPEAPVSGYMFGKGVYLADMSSKSANYCNSYSSENTGLLLLCEAELGKPPLKLTDSDYNAGEVAKSKNCYSTWGVGQTAPVKWKDASCISKDLKGVQMPDVANTKPGPSNEKNAYLMYNEYIVYDVAQIKLRYLLRVKM